MRECHNRVKNSVAGMSSRRLWGGLLAALGLWTLSLPAWEIIKHKDRLNLPGVRVSREYLERINTAKQFSAETPTASQYTPPPRRSRPVRQSTRKAPAPPVETKPLRQPTCDPILIDKLTESLNPKGAWHLGYRGTQWDYADGRLTGKSEYQAEVFGFEAFRFDYLADGGTVEAGIRFLADRAWVEEGLNMQPLTRSNYPEFNPWCPSVGVCWALKQWSAADEVELLDGGKGEVEGRDAWVVEVVHRGRSGAASPWVTTAAERPERRYRLFMDGDMRILQLESRGFVFRYDDYTFREGIEVPCRVRFLAGGILALEHAVDPGSVRVLDARPAEKALKLPTGKPFFARQGPFGAEKIWKENRPDTMGGEAPFGRFMGNGAAEVNIQNLALNVSIPFFNYPQRGKLGLPYGISYSSKHWEADYEGPFEVRLWGKGRFATPQNSKLVFSHQYSRESENGWRNLTGLYGVSFPSEFYNEATGRGVALSEVYQYAILPKILEKAYVRMPDGSTREFLRTPVVNEQPERLNECRDPDRVIFESKSRHWESIDSDGLMLERGNRGLSSDVIWVGNDTLYVADGPAGVKKVVILESGPAVVQSDPTPWGAYGLAKSGNFLYVKTAGAGLQIYDLSGGGLTRVSKTWLSQGDVEGPVVNAAGQVWVLAENRLRVIEGTTITAKSDAVWQGNHLAVDGDTAFLASGNTITLYLRTGESVTQVGQYTVPEPNTLINGLLWGDGALYALVSQSTTGKWVEKLTHSGNTLTRQTTYAVTRLGDRMAKSGDKLYLLGVEAGMDVLDLTSGAVTVRDPFPLESTKTFRSEGVAFNAAGTLLAIAGYGHCLTAYDPALYLGAQPPPLAWEVRPDYDETILRYPDGTRVEFLLEGQRMTDATGENTVLLTRGDVDKQVHVTDTLGRTLDSPLPDYTGTAPSIPENPGSRSTAIPLPGSLGTVTLNYQRLRDCFAPGSGRTIRMNSLNTSEILSGFWCAQNGCGLFGCHDAGSFDWVMDVFCYEPEMLSSIALPNEKSYAFEYNEFGEMTRITYPTGGWEEFEYGKVAPVGPQHQSRYTVWTNRGVTKRYTVADPAHPTVRSLTVYEDDVTPQGGTSQYPAWYRVVRRVKFYHDAAAQAAGALPDEMEEHFFFRDGYRGIEPAYAYGLEHYLNGKEYETRYYLKTGGNLVLSRRVMKEFRARLGAPELSGTLMHPRIGNFPLGWRNPQVVRELTLLCDAQGRAVKAALTRSEYDGVTMDASDPDPSRRYGNLTLRQVFDYAPCDHADDYDPREGLSSLDAKYFYNQSPFRTETFTYRHDEQPGGDAYKALNMVRLVQDSAILQGETVVRHVENVYDAGGGVRGFLSSMMMDPDTDSPGEWLADQRTYDQYGNVTDYHSPAGRHTNWVYDGTNHAFVTQAKTFPATGVELVTQYDTDITTGNLNWVIDPNNQQTIFAYEPDWPCRLIQAEAPNGRLTKLTWDDMNRTVIVAADHDEVNDGAQATKRIFDGLGRLIHEGTTRGDSGWRWAGKRYDGRDRVTGVSNPRGTTTDQAPTGYDYWTSTVYDALGRPVTVTNPDNSTREMTYSLNAETAADEAGHWKTLERDALGRVVKVTEPDGAKKTGLDTTYAYLPSGELTDVFQGVQHRHFAYDGVGNLTSAILPELEFTKEWEYDADGLMTQEFTRGSRASWVAFSYDGIGRPLTKSIVQNSQQTDWYEYLYDGNVQTGWVLPISTFAGHMGRLTAKRGSSNGTAWQECYAYHAPTGLVLDKYLHLDAPSSLLFAPYDTVTHYAYNLSGGLTDVTYPPELSGHSAKAVRLALDTENRPTGAETESNFPLASSLTYVPHGPLQSLSTSQVQSTPSDPLQYSRTYYPDTLRLCSIRMDRLTEPPQSAPMWEFSYSYHLDGNVQQIYHNGFGGVNIEAFVYDALDRLGSVTYGGLGNIGYSYDRYGNLLSRSVYLNAAHTTDAPFEFDASALAPRNRLPGGGDIPAEYDAAGNQTRVTWKEGTTVVSDLLTYDAANRLISCVRLECPQGQGTFTTVSEGSYVYDDGNGRLYTDSIIHGTDGQGHPRFDEKETVYVADPSGETLSEIICEYYTAEYKFEGPQPGGTPSGEDVVTSEGCHPEPSGEKVYYQFTDHLGSTRYTAGAQWKFYHPSNSGFLEYCYQEELFEAPENLTPYGGFLTPNPPPSALDFLAFDPITFTGKPRDVESGLDYFGFRSYSNNLCRWISPDQPFADNQVEQPQSWNLYGYVRNRPLSMIDPAGEAAWDSPNKWDAKAIAGYQKYCETMASQYKEALTCEDFALATLIDYASANGLPVAIMNNNGLYASTSSAFQDVGSFKAAVLESTAAPDLANNTNSQRTTSLPDGSLGNLQQAKPGDFIVGDFNNRGRLHHVQLVVQNQAGQVNIMQGNTDRYLIPTWNSDNPFSSLYIGVTPQSGFYSSKTGNYIRGNALQRGLFKTAAPQVRHWNYEAFNRSTIPWWRRYATR